MFRSRLIVVPIDEEWSVRLGMAMRFLRGAVQLNKPHGCHWYIENKRGILGGLHKMPLSSMAFVSNMSNG
jgi:hypothetical protein